MDALMVALLVGAVAVVAVLLGWFLGSRPGAAAQADVQAARERLAALEREHAVASEQAGRLRLTEESLKAVTEDRDRVASELAAARVISDLHADLDTRHRTLQQEATALRGTLSGAEERLARLAEAERLLEQRTAERDEARRAKAGLETEVKSFEDRLADLRKSRDELITQFRDVGDKLLEKAQTDFLAKADERLHKADRESQAKLQTLLQPVSDTLKRYEEGLQRVEAERKDSYGELRGVLGELRKDNGQVRDEARRLVTALTSNSKQRGRWGERTLENLLLQAGLVKGVDFSLEVTANADEGQVRPDAIIKLPDGRQLIVDSKCSLNAYWDYTNEVDDDKREASLRAHVTSLRNHAQQLGSKDYWARFSDSAEMVVLFVPGEHFLSAALEQDEKDCRGKQIEPLWDWAFKKKVLVTSPTSLLAVAKTIASMWKQDKLAKEAQNIANLGKSLHEQLAIVADHVFNVGKHLRKANDSYDEMVKSFDGRLVTRAKRLEAYGAASAKDLPEIETLDRVPRTLTKLAFPAANNEATAAE